MSVHESQRQVAISKIPQADYNTVTDASDPTNFVGLEVTDKGYAKSTPATADDKEDAHGSDFASEEYLESWDAEAPHDIALSSEQAGRLLYLAFGSVTSSQPAAVTDPTVWQHVFKLQDPTVSRQLPVASMAEVIGTALNRLFAAMLLQSLTFKGDGKKRIDTATQFLGSGRVITPSGLSVANMKTILQQGLHYFFNSQAALTIADAGTLANATNYGTARNFNSWEFGINNNPIADEGYRPGAGKFQDDADPTSGAVRSECLFGLRDIMASQVVRLASQADQLAALKARKDVDWKLDLIGGTISHAYKHKLTVELAKAKYETIDLGASNGLVTQQIKMKPFDPMNADMLVITLINTVASYTV